MHMHHGAARAGHHTTILVCQGVWDDAEQDIIREWQSSLILRLVNGCEMWAPLCTHQIAQVWHLCITVLLWLVIIPQYWYVKGCGMMLGKI